MQEIAHAAVNDGVEAEELQELASLGTAAQASNQKHQSGRLGGLKESPSFRIKVPALGSIKGQPETIVDFNVCLPHLWVASVFDSYCPASLLVWVDKVHQFGR